MTQRLFPSFEPERLREARLIRMSPEMPKRSGEAMRQNVEKLGPRYAEVLKHLRDAASFAGDENLKKLLEDPETQQMIAAQVELPAGDLTKKWLNEIALVFLRKSHEAFKSEETELRAWKDKTTDQAKKCADVFRAAVTEVDAAKTAFGAELPGFSGRPGVELLALLRRGADQPELKKKFDTLIDLQREILWADDAALGRTETWKSKLKAVGLDEPKLKDLKDPMTDPVARRKLLLLLLQDAAGVLPAADQQNVERAVREIDAALSALEDEEKTHIQSRFERSIKYLDRLGGTNHEAIIHLSLSESGKFLFEFLVKRLEILGTKLTVDQQNALKKKLGLTAEADIQLLKPEVVQAVTDRYGIDPAKVKGLVFAILTGGRAAVHAQQQKLPKAKDVLPETFARDLLSLWSTEDAEKYLREEIKVANPPGISFSALALRSKVPPATVQLLEEANFRPRPGLLVSVAKVERFGKRKVEREFGRDKAKAGLDTLFDDHSADPAVTLGWYKIADLKAFVAKILDRGDATVAQDKAQQFLDAQEAAGVMEKSTTYREFYSIKTNEKKNLLEQQVGMLKEEVGEEGFLGREGAQAIVDDVTEKMGAGADFKLKDDGSQLKEYLAFLSFETTGDATNAQAKTIFDTRLHAAGGPVTDGPDGTLLVDRAALVRTLSDLPVAAGGKAMQIHGQLRAGKVHEVTWREAAGNHASEFWKLTKAGAALYGDYLKDLPRAFWDSEGDEKLLPLLNRQAALKKAKAALTTLLSTASGARDLLKRSEASLSQLRATQRQAERGDAVTSPRDNVEQARALLMANQYVIGQLNALGWNMRSKRMRQLTLWMAMYKGTKKDPEAGLKAAQDVLQQSAALTASEDQDRFVDDQMAKMNPTDRNAFLRYIDARTVVEANAGRDVLSPYRARGLQLKPSALALLRQTKDPSNPALNLAANVGRWIIDPPAKVSASLGIILEDTPAKTAYLQAFVTGKDQEYVFQGRTEKVSVIDARLAVEAFQQRLLFEMRGATKGREQIEDEDEFTNPVDRWLRAGVDSMKELWSSDWVGKAEVIAIVLASYWMLKEAWKNKKGKFVILGLPILLGVNAMVKQRTGRDLLGENLRWKNKEDRGSPLEAFRRRSAALDRRYAVLMQPSGQAAIRALMREKNPVKVQELLAWRDAVKAGGGKKFSVGAPASLPLMEITDNLGATGSKEKACEVAFYAFEALCTDVARMNGITGGNTDTVAEQGADLIRQRYVARRGALAPASMFDVILSECQMPTKEMLENRSYLEAVADVFGYTYNEAAALVKKYGVQAWVMMKQGAHLAPEYLEAGKEKVFASWDTVRDTLRMTYAKGSVGLSENLSALWNVLSRNCIAAGIYLKETAPGILDWTVDTSVAGVEKSKEVALNTYRMLLTNGVTGPLLDSLRSKIKEVFGFDIEERWKTPEYQREIADYENFHKTLLHQIGAFATLPPGGEAYLRSMILSASGAASLDAFKTMSVRERLLAYELVKRRIFSLLAAERIQVIYNKRADPDFRSIPLPIDISWPVNPANFDTEMTANNLYQYISTHYDPFAVMGLIGNQHTIAGIMDELREKYPDRVSGKISAVLLYPELHRLFTRDRASDFLMHEIDAYVGEALKEAKEKLSPELYRRYEAYVNTLLTNTLMETILSTDRRPVDLRLLKAQAKDFLKHLTMRRGVILRMSADAPAEENAIWSKFELAEVSEPQELKDIQANPRTDLVLKGEEPPETMTAPSAAPGAAVSPAPTRIEPSEIDSLRRQLDTKIKTAAGRQELLAALNRPGIGAMEGEIRAKFDAEPIGEMPNIGSKPADIEKFVSGLLGRSTVEAKNLGERYLNDAIENVSFNLDQRLQYAVWLANNVAPKRADYPNQPRFQRFLNQAVASLLKETAQEIGSLAPADLSAKKSSYEQLLLALYQCTSEGKDDVFTDDVSRVLEYVLYGGASGKYQEYVDYLKANGNLPPPAAKPTGGWRVRNPGTWFSAYGSDAELRLTKGLSLAPSTISALARGDFNSHHTNAKEAGW